LKFVDIALAHVELGRDLVDLADPSREAAIFSCACARDIFRPQEFLTVDSFIVRV
jgi:hypothetical protein